MVAELPSETLHGFLRRMLLIRRTEEQVIHLATDYAGTVRGNYHVYIGQEATGVGVCAALRPEDYLFTTHRNHGHVVARGGEPGPVLAEILGRATGYNRGRGGTFHVSAPGLGILHTSAIVAGCLPLAAGAAFSIKVRGTDQVSLAFFGDGSLEEGAFYEAINMAALWHLPVVFICENNSVPPAQRSAAGYPSSTHAASQLVDVPRAFNIPSQVVDGADVAAVHALASDVVDRTRRGEGPFFVEARTTRWPGSRGIDPELVGGDFDIAWAWDSAAAPEAIQDWLRHSDPVSLFARRLVEQGLLDRRQVEDLDREVRGELAQAARYALESPHPLAEGALDHIFA